MHAARTGVSTRTHNTPQHPTQILPQHHQTQEQKKNALLGPKHARTKFRVEFWWPLKLRNGFAERMSHRRTCAIRRQKVATLEPRATRKLAQPPVW